MDWLMLIVFVTSWLFAAAALFGGVAVVRGQFPEADYFSYMPSFSVGLVLLLLFVWTGILRPELPVIGFPLLPLGAGALASFGLAATVGLLNRPRFLVPKRSRDQPSPFQDWLEHRRRHVGKVGALGRVIVPHRVVVRLKVTAKRMWRVLPGHRLRDLSFEAPSLDALEAELIRRCQNYFQNPSPALRAPQLVFDWWDESWHEIVSPDHGATPHIHTSMHVVEIEIERAPDAGGYMARSSQPALTVEAPSLERLVPLVRSSLFQREEASGHGRDQLHFIYTGNTA